LICSFSIIAKFPATLTLPASLAQRAGARFNIFHFRIHALKMSASGRSALTGKTVFDTLLDEGLHESSFVFDQRARISSGKSAAFPQAFRFVSVSSLRSFSQAHSNWRAA